MESDERLSLFASVRKLCAQWVTAAKGMLGMKLRAGDFSSQRMCPFCGLITSRHESHCLECGKDLVRE